MRRTVASSSTEVAGDVQSAIHESSSSTNDACHVQRAIHESFRVGVVSVESDFARVIRESRESAGMKRCYICGEWTMNPVRSSTHPACPHSACRLKCLLEMEMDHVDRIFEMDDMDEMLRTRSCAAANPSDSIVTHDRSNARSRSPRRD